MKFRYIPLLIIGLYAAYAQAMEPFTVKDIRVEGIQRTEAGTVFNYLPIKAGEVMDDQKAAAAIKALYATGFFKDVRLEAEGDVLVVVIQERPAIAQIDFTGNKSFPSDKMKEGLKSIGLTEGMTFDRSMLDKAEQEIKRQYLSQGKYGATVKAVVNPLERNRVGIQFNIEEGAISKIRSINIVGNHDIEESELLGLFQLTTPNWMSWWNKDDQYSKQKLTADLEALRSFYMNQGYLEFNIDSTQVSITPDKRDIYITINITEGEKYTVTDIKMAGDMLVPEDELRALVKVQPGEIFNREKLTESSKAIGDRLGNDGFAFSNVNAVPEVDKEKHTVAFTFFVDPGRRVYVRRVNLTGNLRTRDEVLRREMRQLESSVYAADKIERSKARLNRTGYFEDVNIETPAVPGSADEVDLNINVTEKSTGSIMFGAGLSSSEGIVFNFTVNQTNFLGTGNRVSTSVNTGKVNTTYALSFTDPYFTPDGISRGFDIYKRDVDTNSLNVGSYSTASYGAGLRFGIPLNERDNVTSGLTLDFTSISLTADSPQNYIDFCQSTNGCDNNSLRLDLGWTHDTRDNVLYPNNGLLQKVFGEVTMPVLDSKYYKVGYQHTWFKNITKGLVLMLNGEVGYGNSYAGGEFPFFKNYYVGGVSTVRGYDTSSVGPRALDTNNTNNGSEYAVGGTKKLVGNAEVLFPVPFLNDSKQWRLSVFMDAGSAWGNQSVTTLAPDSCSGMSDCMRYSAGVGASWYSPFGPIRVYLAEPLNDKPGDKTQIFQFQMGSQF
jgi:outer membrane protein insertion porin family